jgi:transposase
MQFSRLKPTAMANHRIQMSKIRQVLVLRSQGKTFHDISREIPIHRRTGTHYAKMAEATGLSWEELLSKHDEELMLLIAPPPEGRQNERRAELESRFEQIEKELKKTGQTRWNQWVNYKQECPGGYNYSQFCDRLSKWIKHQEVSMVQEHKFGDKMFMDYAGKHLRYADALTGEVLDAEVLVSVLGGSQYMNVEAQQSQKFEDLGSGLVNTVEFWGGVPQAVVVDNMKAAVHRSDRYEPQVQQPFADLCSHYGMAVLPTRARKPKDKAHVENSVKLAYMWIYARIGDEIPVGLDGLNALIRKYLKEANDRKFQNRTYSRSDLFETQEKPLLRPLPQTRYEPKQFAQLRVHKTSHIQLRPDFHYYSVPYQYIGKDVRIYYTQRNVEIYFHGQRIASHLRNRKPHAYTTLAEHLPSTHRFVADWNPEKFLCWAGSISAPVKDYIRQLLQGRLHPEQAYKSCVGILSMEKKYGKDRLTQACTRAAHFGSFSYMTIRRILTQKLDLIPLEPELPFTPLPGHDNLRGSEYYQ